MRTWSFGLPAAVVLALSLGAAPAMAQNTQGNSSTDNGPKASQTGVGQRGTEVGPSTQPGQPSQPGASQTGTGPRGTEVGPSTNPAQSNQKQ